MTSLLSFFFLPVDDPDPETPAGPVKGDGRHVDIDSPGEADSPEEAVGPHEIARSRFGLVEAAGTWT